jgi:dolichol-phosphate mannosyltransferase
MTENTNPPAVSVVVPVFNEEENIPTMQTELRQALVGIDHEILFVDDGSSDGTVERIERRPEIRILRFAKNTGQSAAMYAGLNAARGATVVLIDGDLQNDPADIPRLLAEIARGADLVCGYRAQRKDTVVKRITSRVANFVRSRFTKDGVRDTGCSLKAMRRECVSALLPFKGMHRFIPALVKGAGYRLVEIPVNHRPRRFGLSKYGLGNRAIRATVDMFGVRWLLSRQVRYKLQEDVKYGQAPPLRDVLPP